MLNRLSNISWPMRMVILAAWCIVGASVVLMFLWWTHISTVLMLFVLASLGTFLVVYNANNGDLAATEDEILDVLKIGRDEVVSLAQQAEAAAEAAAERARAAAKAEWQKVIAASQANPNQPPPPATTVQNNGTGN